MVLYPINLKVEGRLCTIIGGGRVALRKAEALSACGARLRVVAKDPVPELQNLGGNCELLERPYREGDLAGSFLAIAATDDDETNRAVEAEAHAAGIPLNVVDKPEQCDFFVPSSIRRGDLMLTVSTGGQLPALSKRLRRQLERQFPEEWSQALELLSQARRQVIGKMSDRERKRQCLADLAAIDLVDIIRESGNEAAEAEIEKCISRY